MRIGIYFTPNKEQGGVYQYSVSILEALYQIKGNDYFIISTSKDILEKYSKSKRFSIVDLHSATRVYALKTRDFLSSTLAFVAPGLMNFCYRFGLFSLINPLNKFINRNLIKVIDYQNLDVVIYPTSSNLSFLCKTPSVVAIHDLQHRISSQFPEVSAGGRWEYREYGYTEISRKAFRILADSAIDRKYIIKFYRADPKAVEILQYLPPLYLKSITENEASRICKKLKLPEDFIFYPARFWPHKNHINLIRAINKLVNSGKSVNLVLTGNKQADFSTFTEVMKMVDNFGLNKRVFYLGYISNKELSAVYKRARALVMPTFNGTYNIPPLEAWKIGTPVLTSDLEGCRDQLGEAGILVDPKSPEDIAKKIWRIYKNDKLRKTLIKKGRERLKDWTFLDFKRTISKVLKDFEKKMGA